MRRLPVILVSLCALAVAAGAASAKTFRFAFQGDLITTDPYNANETFTNGVLNHIYEGLVRYDRELKIEPALAASWTVVEPTVWRFKLRENVKFHNGAALTADDVVFSFERAKGEDSDQRGSIAEVKEVRKIDDLTVEIVTQAPYPILTRSLAGIMIMNKKWSIDNGAEKTSNLQKGQTNFAAFNANGTGPFILKSRRPDIRTELVVNPNWWDKPNHNVTEVIFTPIKSDATRVAALLSGEVDMMWPVPLQDVDRVNATPGRKVMQGPEERMVFFGMDQHRNELLYSNVKGKNPFKDIRVRRAVYQALDMNAIKNRIMRGTSVPSALLLAPTTNGYDRALDERYPYDPAAAKKFLTEAGYADGFEVTLDCPNDRYVNDEAICQAAVAMLARIGIKVNLLAQTKGRYFGKILKQDTSFYMLGWAASTVKDGHNTLSQIVACKDGGLGGSYNCGGYCDRETDELIRKVGAEIDPVKRQQYMSAAFKRHKEDFGHIPLHQQALAWGVRDGVTLLQTPDDILRIWHVTVN